METARKVVRGGRFVAAIVAVAVSSPWVAARATAPKPFVPSTLLVVRYDSRSIGSPASGVVLALHGRNRQVLSHRISLGDPAVSPNRRLIAFGSTDGLYLMKRDGSDLHRATASPGPSPCGNDYVIVWDPMWSADAKMLSFDAENGSDGIERCPPGVADIFGPWVFDRATKSAAPLTDSLQYPWSAVGHALLAEASSSSGNAIITDAAAGREYILARNALPVFAPDRRSLEFDTSTLKGISSVWISDARGDAPVRVGRVHGYIEDVAWSPNGQYLAMDVTTKPNATGKQFQRLVAFSLLRHTFRLLTRQTVGISRPVWSPNGKKIAYITTANPSNYLGGPYGVWMINANGGTPSLLLTTDHSMNGDLSFDGLVWF
jgi:Tol biopolymer transport system component